MFAPNPAEAFGSNWPVPDVVLVFAVVGLVIHFRRFLPMIVVITSLLISSLVLASGIMDLGDSRLLSGHSNLLPCMLAGVGLTTLSDYLNAHRSPAYAATLIIIVMGLSLLPIL